jgi:ketosteroid isomerase-like protein
VTPRDTVSSYLAAFASGDPDRIASHVTEDFVNEQVSALGVGCVGRDEYRRRLSSFLADFRGLRYEIEDIVGDGDRVIAAYTLHANHSGHEVHIRGVMRFVIRDEAIAHRYDYWDGLTFLQQVGQA